MMRDPKPDFERYMITLRCEEPDRVPLGDFHIDKLPKQNFMGRNIDTLQDQIDFWHTAGYDYVTASSGILEPVRAPEGMTTKGEAVHTEYGDRVAREWAQEHEGIITNWEEFEKFPWPTADDFDLSQWDFFDKNLPQGMKGILMLGKIYTFIWMAMGAETFFKALEQDEELIAAMFDKVGSIQYETFLRVIDHPSVGAVFHPDDIAHNTGLLVNPRHLRKYLFPWYKKIGAVCRDKALGNVFHSDGDCTEVLDDLVACGFHGFNPVQPNAMDIEATKKGWGKKLCLIGNINLDSTLTTGTPQDVKAEVYERIRTIGPGGGYMVASSNSITDYVPLENMKALIDATFEFGRYPIELEEGGIKGKVWTYLGKGKTEKAALESKLDVGAYYDGLLSRDVTRVMAVIEKDKSAGVDMADIMQEGLISAMTLVGKKFQEGEIYIPEMMMAAQIMQGTIEKLRDELSHKTDKKSGSVVIGTVKGDLHDIGKSLVSMMLAGQGFTVKDMGISVSPEEFIATVKDQNPDILALSALLTTTMIEMKQTIQALEEAGMRDRVKVIVGGAPVTRSFADEIGADGYAYDAPGAAELCKTLISE